MTAADDLALAHRLADAAAEVIRPFFRSEATQVENKGDATPVTEADRAAELAMREILAHERPDDGVRGEEFPPENEGAARQWVLDPIDGTTSFIAGRPIFGTLIALVEEGWPTMGLLNQAVSGERWAARTGQDTEFGGTPAKTRACSSLDVATLATSGPQYFTDHEAEHFLALAAKTARRRMIFGGDCYNYGLLAAGYIDIVVEAGLKLHDFAALVPIVEGAGGMMCDWSGEPLTEDSAGDVIALGDPARLEDVIEALACHHH